VENLYNPEGFVIRAPKSTISARPFLISYPTGCCIHPLARSIQSADRLVAIATIQMERAWTFFETLFQPKIQRPMKTDSIKNATVASMARGAPKMSPTYLEYSAQFIPNWNSMVMPVTTPSAKLIRNSFPQNLVIFKYSSSPVFTHLVSIYAVMIDSPSVSGTNIK
jgi:hypothetical protein